jgi:poly(hydroxyalkanoate) granule-associated protein
MAKKNDVRESAHKIWLAGLGALAVAEEEGSKLFKTLVNEGERFEAAGKERFKGAKKGADDAAERARRIAEEAAERARKAAEGAWEQLGEAFDERLSKALHRVGVPTRDEIAALARRVEELTRAVERKSAPGKGGASKSSASQGGASKSGPKAAKAPAGKSTKPTSASAPPPIPRKITTAADVTTTADVKTPPSIPK